MKTRIFVSLPVLVALFGACSHGDTAPAPPGVAGPASSAPAASVATIVKASPGGSEEDFTVPREKFSDGERAFRAVKETLLEHYYGSGLTEDDLYRAAADGMLSRIDPKMHKWNKLLSPSELAEMDADLKGEVIGIGVKINFDSASGYTDILSVIPGSPAERARIQVGDKVISVDNKLYKGKQSRDVVADIRGKAGETVTLTVLRDDKLLVVPIRREVVPLDAATGAMLPGDTAYVAIHAFNSKTPGMLADVLKRLNAAHAMVVDLRGNAGGLFEEAVTSASFFLKEGTPIVKVEKRNEAVETFSAKGERLVGDIPLAVLVDGETSSGGEFFAAALSESRGAQIVGSKTYGKWSVQKIDKLSNGYAMKYTVSIFQTPSGRSYGGVGLSPDVEVTMDEKAVAKAAMSGNDPVKRLENDAQMRTAVTIVRGHM